MGVTVSVALGQEVTQAADAGVGDQNIDGAEGFHACFISGADAVHICHVHPHGHGLGALGTQLGGQILHGLTPGGQHHIGAVLDERAGDAFTDALGSAGDQRGFS